jgi:hypothetical protein
MNCARCVLLPRRANIRSEIVFGRGLARGRQQFRGVSRSPNQFDRYRNIICASFFLGLHHPDSTTEIVHRSISSCAKAGCIPSPWNVPTVDAQQIPGVRDDVFATHKRSRTTTGIPLFHAPMLDEEGRKAVTSLRRREAIILALRRVDASTRWGATEVVDG